MATFASDNFTDSDGTLLQSHTPTGGGSWAKVIGGTGTDIEIYSNGAAPSGNGACYRHTTAPAGAEYDVSATVSANGNVNYTVGVTARQSSSVETNYLVWPAVAWTLYKTVSGAFTSLGTYSTGPAATDTYKLECKDATKKLFVNGVERISSTNNDVTAAGFAGLRCYGTTTTPQGDTWFAEQVGGSPSLDVAASALALAGTVTATGDLQFGVGLDLAASALSVAGTVSVAGDLQYLVPSLDLSASPLSLSGTLTPSGDVQIGTAFDLAASALPLAGAVTTSGDIQITTAIVLDIAASPLAVSGTVSASGDLAFGTSLDLAAGSVAMAGVLSVAGDISADTVTSSYVRYFDVLSGQLLVLRQLG